MAADATQVKELTAKLEQGIQDLFNSETYANYLKTMSRFHNYSTRNTLLIHLQRPNATLVAGFRSWQSKFGRHVKKGEKAMQILAPVPFTKREEKEKLDPDTLRPILDENGMPVVEVTEQRFIAKFNVVNVFDVAQTDGKPLPSLAQDLSGNVEQYEAFMDALRSVSPLPIVFEALPDDMDGVCRFGKEIAIREGMSQIQTVCAAVHEIAHAKLHDIESLRLTDEKAVPKDRRTQEVEAESLAFTILAYFNIETGANSFGYIAEWSKGRELKELNASLDTIRKAAAELIDAIDGKFREIAKDRDITFAIGEQQAELAEPELAAAKQTPAASADKPTPGALYARYCNQVVDYVRNDTDYISSILDADEENAGIDNVMAVARAVIEMAEKDPGMNELLDECKANADFRGRLEDYVFMRTYLEPQTARRYAVKDAADVQGNAEPDKHGAQEPKPRYLPGYDDDGRFIRQFAVLNAYVRDVSVELKANDVSFTFAEGNTDYLTFFVIPDEADAGKCRDALEKLGVENLFNVPESELKPLAEAAYRQKAEKQYDLGYGFLGNGITVWNRAEEKNGDYATVAHIAPDRSVTFYDKDMPHEVKQRIDTVANSPDTWAMGFSAAPENIPPRIEGAATTTSVYETVKRVMHETAAQSPVLLPDPSMTIAAMREYGYKDGDGIMLPLSESWALQLFDSNTAVYLLYPDDTEAMALDRADIENHDGIFGVEESDWKQTPEYAAQKAAIKNAEGKREADLLYGDNPYVPENKFGIYQIRRDIDEARNYRFAPLREMEAHGLSADRANYELVYTAPFTERVEFLSDRYPVLNRIYADFNNNHPADFTGHSLSVSDVVVLRCNGDISAHYCDSTAFVELDSHAFFGEETRTAPVAEALARENALYQDGTRTEEYTSASVAELEADVNAGKVISLLDLSQALNAERKSGNNRSAAPKARPTLMERLEAGKQKAAMQGQHDAQKNKEREVRE